MLAKGLPLTTLAIYQGGYNWGIIDLVWLIGTCSGGR